MKSISYSKILIESNSCEIMINEYLNNICKKKLYNKYKKNKLLVDKIYNNYTKCNPIIKNEAGLITDDLIDKCFYRKGRTIKRPISICNLTEYSISSIIRKKDVNNVIKMIILKLAITYYCINL